MPDHRPIEISIVVPVYNAVQTLEELASRVREVMLRLAVEYELILVDDGSRDGSWNVLQQLQSANPERLTAIELMRNFGQHNALMCGLQQSRGRFIVTIDDDLQTPPEEIPKLLDTIRQGNNDVVYGVYESKKHSLWRRLGSGLTTRFYRWIFGCDVAITSFRILNRDVVDAILSYDLNFTYIDGLVAWNTQRIGQVKVVHQARQHGSSGYSVAKLVVLALNLMTNFSLLPLQVVSLCGFVTAICGVLAGIYYLIQYLASNIVVPGYASTIIAVLVLGGLQLLSLGVLGEYVGRLHLNVNRKPQYTVRRIMPQTANSDLCNSQNSHEN